ncbi:unnamed protein product, partial [Ectocarpus fasciculatus]
RQQWFQEQLCKTRRLRSPPKESSLCRCRNATRSRCMTCNRVVATSLFLSFHVPLPKMKFLLRYDASTCTKNSCPEQVNTPCSDSSSTCLYKASTGRIVSGLTGRILLFRQNTIIVFPPLDSW